MLTGFPEVMPLVYNALESEHALVCSLYLSTLSCTEFSAASRSKNALCSVFRDCVKPSTMRRFKAFFSLESGSVMVLLYEIPKSSFF
jgi:hypothetical protein